MALSIAQAREHVATACNDTGSLSLAHVLTAFVNGDFNAIAGVTSSAAELNKLDGATLTTAELNLLAGIGCTVTIALAASSTSDGMDITITVKDAAGSTVAAVHNLEIWMSEAATGIGLTADTYSGDLTASVGAILSAHTAKKHWSVVTAATGIFTGTLVDTANPADQYVVARRPLGGRLVVSAASGTNWGA